MEVAAPGAYACRFCGLALDPTYAECPSCGQPMRRGLSASAWNGYTPALHFVVLCAMTFGAYLVIWFYRVWRFLRDEARSDVNPLVRTALLIVPIVNLFWTYQAMREVVDFTSGSATEANVAFGVLWAASLATRFVNPVDRWFVLFTLLACLAAWTIQRRINAYYREQHGITGARMPIYGWAICGIGPVLWLGVFLEGHV
jgi:hypothetical protein